MAKTEPCGPTADRVALATLHALRKRLHRVVRRALAFYGHGKSYEGAVELRWPGVRERDITLTIHCYVLGPGRHYTVTGPDLHTLIDAATAMVMQWERELDQEITTHGRYREEPTS